MIPAPLAGLFPAQLPMQALTEVPRVLGGLLPGAAALASVPGAAVPPGADGWFGVADDVARNWGGDSGGAAAGSLSRAALGASALEGNAADIDAAVLEGTTAITAAAFDIGVLAAQFVATATTTVAASAAGGPAGMFTAAAGLQSEATATLSAAATRIARLETELAGPISALEAAAARDVDLPAPPGDGGSIPVAAGSPGASPAPGEGMVPVSSTGASNGTGMLPTTGTIGQSAGTGDVAGSRRPVVGSSESAPTPQAQAAVDHALSALGTPYQWGGNTPGVGLDCSGLTHWAYGQAGVDIPRTAAEQAVGRPVDASELLPGDLVVWDGHVAMVIGDGQMVEAGDPVQVNPIRTSNLGMGFMGFWRPTG